MADLIFNWPMLVGLLVAILVVALVLDGLDR